MVDALLPCPCGSGKLFPNCCQPVIANDSANSAEQLMRSRYTAFTLADTAYILKTWHPDSCPTDFQLGKSHWLGLTIHHTDKYTVSFTAAFYTGNKCMVLKEKSHFIHIDNHWRYVNGDCSIVSIKKNEPCFCTSGKKHKNCCRNKFKKVFR